MMGFHETAIFPEQISYGTIGGPGFNTQIIENDSGTIETVARWNSPRWRYNAKYGVKTYDDLQELITFYIARRGVANGFRFLDPLDNTSAADGRSQPTATDQMIGIGDGSTKTFQLKKIYTNANYSVVRNIYKPIENTVLVAINGEQQSSGWSCNCTTGIITFTTAPSSEATVTAGYKFHVPVMFGKELDEKLPVVVENFNVGSISDIPLVEMVFPAAVIEDEIYRGGGKSITITDDYELSILDGIALNITPSTGGLILYLPIPENLQTGGPYFFIRNNSSTYSLLLKTNLSDPNYPNQLLHTLLASTAIIIVLVKDANNKKIWIAF